MFNQLHMREEQVLLAQDYALETARAEGLEQGLERGKVEGRAERKLFAFLDIVR
ncbi:adenylosuccinate lyase [Streptococcus pneumoniae]|nr:adenylosuccinate lyase [Streptococcus pneumoniae]